VFKYVNGSYVDVTSLATISGNTITLHLTDGGLGDADGNANGVIIDPVVPVRIVPAGPAPTVTKLSPKSGPVAGGTAVKITGSNFIAGATTIKFGNVSAAGLKVNSTSSITAVAPSEGASAVDVTVSTPNGSSVLSTRDHFKFTPTVTGLSATTTVFKFGATKATNVNCSSTTSCTVRTPPHAAGTVDVKATVNKVGSPSTTTDRFTYS
jgi:hypothetical protein